MKNRLWIVLAAAKDERGRDSWEVVGSYPEDSLDDRATEHYNSLPGYNATSRGGKMLIEWSVMEGIRIFQIDAEKMRWGGDVTHTPLGHYLIAPLDRGAITQAVLKCIQQYVCVEEVKEEVVPAFPS